MKRAFILSILLILHPLVSETLELRNGDRFQGKLLSVQENGLEWEHAVLGKLTIPKEQVAAVYFVTPQAVETSHKISSITNGAAQDTSKMQIAPEMVDKVRMEILGAAPQEAQDQFNEMVSGLVSGKIQVGDVRKMAIDTVAEVESLREDLGEDVGFALDGYLSILKSFIGKTAPAEEPKVLEKEPQPEQKAK